ncbi:MAG: PDZ domain-containing protein [Gammaproteobacteria bacterium]
MATHRSLKVALCFAAGVFAVGGLAGFLGAQFHTMRAPDVVPSTPLATPSPEAQTRAGPIRSQTEAAAGITDAPTSGGPLASADPLPSAVLAARLDEERTERERLETELQRLRSAFVALERRIETANIAQTQAAGEAGEDAADVERPRRVDTETLLDAGFDDEDASFIAQRWGEQQMALLRLRDRAQREGWLGEARYQKAVRAVTRGEDSLRSLLDEEEYDRFLFGTGRTNRVRVDQVIEGSPAQLVGLGADDVLLRYDDAPVHSFEDLRAAIGSGGAGENATLEVERDGRLLQFVVPRGPIGVQVQGVSIEP